MTQPVAPMGKNRIGMPDSIPFEPITDKEVARIKQAAYYAKHAEELKAKQAAYMKKYYAKRKLLKKGKL